MKIAHLCTADQYGGAAKSAYRIHASLRRLGVQSHMYVRRKDSDDPSVTAVSPQSPEEHDFFDMQAARISEARQRWMAHLDYSLAFYTDHGKEGLALMRHIADADIVHLHWVADNFFDPTLFFTAKAMKKPVVWRLPDMAPLTGGCHFTASCTRFLTGCGACPVLESDDENDLSAKVFERRRHALGSYQGPIHFVGPCSWMATTIQSSPLTRTYTTSVVHNGVDTDLFKPTADSAFRDQHDISGDSVVITFAAFLLPEARKGLDILLAAAQTLADLDITLVFIGHVPPEPLPDIKCVSTGHIDDTSIMRDAYCASDIVVVPSTADNLPNVIFEAMACGAAVIASDVGGIADIVHPEETGLLVPAGDVAALAEALKRLTCDATAREALGKRARTYCLEHLSLDCEAHKYIKLYDSLLSGNDGE
ncbi:glycosyltransferase [Kordiimonas aestuarii]|uniref:glycosyltransferase n=1 Tax=Kordiimonas aestuarii TaxID=1005925 RepID=UPI0021CF291E|nr:glycosyltransferase [Kordiimonas aestuarii]